MTTKTTKSPRCAATPESTLDVESSVRIELVVHCFVFVKRWKVIKAFSDGGECCCVVLASQVWSLLLAHPTAAVFVPSWTLLELSFTLQWVISIFFSQMCIQLHLPKRAAAMTDHRFHEQNGLQRLRQYKRMTLKRPETQLSESIKTRPVPPDRLHTTLDHSDAVCVAFSRARRCSFLSVLYCFEQMRRRGEQLQLR